ncbi:MAG: hypothetical protein PF690_05385 [Deltaproteobacteria bacterium]|jgi:phage terminase large subunit-like protein|nr:hypothetical protein [Deltaproteobacteria bacterium]
MKRICQKCGAERKIEEPVKNGCKLCVKSRYNRLQCKNLTDSYIRSLLNRHGVIKLTRKEIPQELIKLKREQIKMFRLIKECENAMENKEPGDIISF